ncbi:MAG: hypothetical protein HY608_11710 [Planctomycetes bacterium]|nr:hypothetical protein [Planctomycetota bacterium]
MNLLTCRVTNWGPRSRYEIVVLGPARRAVREYIPAEHLHLDPRDARTERPFRIAHPLLRHNSQEEHLRQLEDLWQEMMEDLHPEPTGVARLRMFLEEEFRSLPTDDPLLQDRLDALRTRMALTER